MKRILLSISVLATLSVGTMNAQWVRYPSTGTSTGLAFSGGTAATAGVGSWGGYTPNFSENTCNTYAGEYWGGAGANSGAPKDSTNQVAYTLSGVQNGYDNPTGVAGATPCYATSSSFSVGLGGGTNLDLSATTDRHLTISVRSTVAFRAQLLMFNSSYAAVNSSTTRPYIDIVGDNVFHVYTMNFDTSVVTASINSVFLVAFLYDGTTALNGRVFIDGFAIGSAPSLTTDVKEAASMIASSKVYPNPVSDIANVELNLKSPATVKVILSDLMGKQVMTIKEGTFSSLSESFSVANLNKGMYTVNYYVNGAAAKAEMLMVK